MHRWPLVHPEVLQERPIKDNAGDAAQSACHLHERSREIVGGRRVRRLRCPEAINGLPMHWTRGGFPTPISSYQGAFIHHRSLDAASGAPSEATPAKRLLPSCLFARTAGEWPGDGFSNAERSGK